MSVTKNEAVTKQQSVTSKRKWPKRKSVSFSDEMSGMSSNATTTSELRGASPTVVTVRRTRSLLRPASLQKIILSKRRSGVVDMAEKNRTTNHILDRKNGCCGSGGDGSARLMERRISQMGIVREGEAVHFHHAKDQGEYSKHDMDL